MKKNCLNQDFWDSGIIRIVFLQGRPEGALYHYVIEGRHKTCPYDILIIHAVKPVFALGLI